MNNWKEFYEKRINSSYQDYFNERYEKFIEFIVSFQPIHIVEAGCGIGSVGNAIYFYCSMKGLKIDISGFDLSKDMVNLANRNKYNKLQEKYIQGDIFQNSYDGFAVTHGVLEHFSDEEILKISHLYPNSIHYVPLDKYHEPSFGDERLMSKDFWLDLLKPEYYFTMNNEHDLVFKL